MGGREGRRWREDCPHKRVGGKSERDAVFVMRRGRRDIRALIWKISDDAG
jgi:hypothetical protein